MPHNFGIKKNNNNDMAAFSSDPEPHLSSSGQAWKGDFMEKRFNFYLRMPSRSTSKVWPVQKQHLKIVYRQFLCTKDCLMSFLSLDDMQTNKVCHHQLNLIYFEIFFAFISIFCVYISQTNDYTQNLIEFVALHWNLCALAIKCDTVKTA